MPRSLTAEVTQAIAAQTYGYDLLVEAPSVGLRLSWFFHPNATWEHRLLHIDALEIGVPPGGGVGFVSQLAFTMAEDGQGQSLTLLDDQTTLYGAVITCKLLFAGEAYGEALALFTGRIEHWELSDGEAHLLATDDRLARNLLLPQTLVTLASHPHAPDESLGQAIPIVYGYGNTLAPIPLLLVDQDERIYQVSSHGNGLMLPVFGAWPPGADRLKTVAASPAQATILGTNRLQLMQRLTETKLGSNTAAPTLVSTVGTVQQAANLIDNDPETPVLILTTGVGGIGRIVEDFVHPDPVGVNTIDIGLQQHRRLPTSAVTVHGNFVLDSVRHDGTIAIQGLFASLERRVASVSQTEQFRVAGVSLEAGHVLRMTMSAINEAGVSATTNDGYQVGGVTVEASYLASGPFEHIYIPDVSLSNTGVFVPGVFDPDVFASVTGVVFQGRMDDAEGTITGVANQVLQTPVDILASILHDELGLTVDASTLSAAQTARQTWKAAGGLGFGWFRPRAAGLDLLHSLCLQAACYLFPQGDGTYTIKALAPLETAPLSIGPAGSATDFLLTHRQDQTAPASTWRRTLRYRGGRSDAIRNAFEIRYAWHAARQQFGKVALASWAGTNDPANYLDAGALHNIMLSAARYGPREPYTLDADFLYDDATVWMLMNTLIAYWTSPRHELEFESTMAPLPLLLGETVEVDTEGMPPGMRGQVYEIDRLRYDFEQGRIFLHGTQRPLYGLDYFAINDQEGTTWYWWIDGIGMQLVRDLALPSPPQTFLRNISVDPLPSWLAIADETATTRYVWPTPLGQVTVTSTPPDLGTGYTGSPVWREQLGHQYQLTTTAFLQFTVEEYP